MDRSLSNLVRDRARHRCEYCLMPAVYDPIPFEIDHVIARKHGGTSDSENLALACFACNNHKGPNIAGFDPRTGLLSCLYHPRRDVRAEHFGWEGAQLMGLSPEGRTTVAVLNINLPHRVAFRAALMDEGVWGDGEQR